MNWFSQKFDKGTISRTLADGRSDLCDHVEKDHAVAHVVHSELDSFGPVGVFICCKECHEKHKAEDDAEMVICHDCKKAKPKGETFEWKWYDFYAAQGDEALIICKECHSGEAHKERVREDREALNWELGRGSAADDDC